jgi:hypothetical protein
MHVEGVLQLGSRKVTIRFKGMYCEVSELFHFLKNFYSCILSVIFPCIWIIYLDQINPSIVISCFKPSLKQFKGYIILFWSMHIKCFIHVCPYHALLSPSSYYWFSYPMVHLLHSCHSSYLVLLWNMFKLVSILITKTIIMDYLESFW